MRNRPHGLSLLALAPILVVFGLVSQKVLPPMIYYVTLAGILGW